MKNMTFLIVVFLLVSVNSSFAQRTMLPPPDFINTTIIREIAPSDFKNYEETLLVVPAFKAIGTKKWLTKRFDKHYMKPFHVADVSEVADGLGPDKYPLEAYKYMVFIKNYKRGIPENTTYEFFLIDRSTNTAYFHPSAINMLNKYLKKLMK